MKMKKEAARICLCLTAAILLLAVPVAAEESELPPEYPSENLGKEGFQKEGRDYIREAVLKVRENYVTEDMVYR